MGNLEMVDKIINIVSLLIPFGVGLLILLMLLLILADIIRTILIGERAGDDPHKLQMFIDQIKGDKDNG